MRLYRDDRAELHAVDAAERQELRRGGAAPGGHGARFGDPAGLREAWDAADGGAADTPRHRAAHSTADGRARRAAWASPPGLYRGLRPEALAMALYIGAQVRELSGGASPLVVTSTVRDERYQRLLVRRTARRRATTPCTRPAGRSTSSAATALARRRAPSSSCSTGCRCSERSPGCASRTRSTSPWRATRSRFCLCSTG